MSELSYSLPSWDLHNVGSLFNQNFNLDAWGIIDESPENIFCSPEMEIGDVSTGYLEDALIEFSGRSKRRRLSFNGAEDKPNYDIDHSQNHWGLSENYSCTSSQFAEKNDYDEKKRIVYPFGVVKPGGREEDITLNDINKRILMPPARPVRHPVGDFACRPCVSADGPGLSGKAVVAFTKIQTLGRGTITIIRTKG
ncbi:hypothetical protein ISN45_Aa01g006800 [Arabidopsis thaliana x Arabidopsis arenosa]|uniref:Protein XRI1 n=1 Tax=Arabidopsis thaliana x Arabidopsis arenosa TaxID=1240361 RepID=A0A8T2BW71_9BRAS|nr:hypothetical protein ISN45_Aa01g006800 [Arabidopsis thaliana x Arabidopsis arenosa]